MENLESIGIIITLAVALASAVVGAFNPKPGSIGAKIIKVLNIISVINPRAVKVTPRDANHGNADETA